MAEFFAGIGLMRIGLEMAGFNVVWANDVDPHKAEAYGRAFGVEHLLVGDVRAVRGTHLPEVELATASFPCTDLSLAGGRAGLEGSESGLFWEFARVLEELEDRRPRTVMLENVLGFATSNRGKDLESAIRRLNELGYVCDIIAVDARHFVPQSRPRMFVVGSANASAGGHWAPSDHRPAWVEAFVRAHPDLKMGAFALPGLPSPEATLKEVVERLSEEDDRWWPAERVRRFVSSLSELQRARLAEMANGKGRQWRTAYRRTRNGIAVWEIRADKIAGCLRTARGGSSRQAIVEAGRGKTRIRWMTPREYARLQGAGAYPLDESADNKAVFGFGDAVCVPVIEWIAKHYLATLVTGRRPSERLVAV